MPLSEKTINVITRTAASVCSMKDVTVIQNSFNFHKHQKILLKNRLFRTG